VGCSDRVVSRIVYFFALIEVSGAFSLSDEFRLELYEPSKTVV